MDPFVCQKNLNHLWTGTYDLSSKLIKPTWWPHGIHIPGSLIPKAWRHFSWSGQRAKTCWDVQDKMSTKNWDGQNANHRKKSGRNANHRKKSGQNANLWLAFRPVGILSGWHLSYHQLDTYNIHINISINIMFVFLFIAKYAARGKRLWQEYKSICPECLCFRTEGEYLAKYIHGRVPASRIIEPRSPVNRACQ